MASALQNLALATLGQNEYAHATVLAKEGLALHQEVDSRSGIAGCLTILAMIAGAQCWPIHASRLYGAAEALNEAIGASMAPASRTEYDRNVTAARIQATEAEFAAAWAEGRAMPLQDAIATALAEKAIESPVP